MALSGKKITELNPISDVTNKTVLPTVYIDDTYTEATATKVTVQQLKTNILNGAVLQPNIITDTESTSIELNKILANTIYQYGTLSSLSITTFDTSYQDSYIYFKTSESGFNFSFSNAHWITLYEPSFKLNTDYIIHLKNGVCVLEQPENPILNITATGGSIALTTNTVNSITVTANTTFVLPQTVNNNILNKIILQIKITGTPTIDWGTTHYLVDSFTLTTGTYDIVYEYDSLNSYWKVGLLYSTGGGGGTVDQTYDPTSTNAQSGTAVAEAVEPALKNTATATNSLVILGTPTWGTSSITIGKSAAVYAHGAVAIGQNASITNGQGVAIGLSASADGQGVGIGNNAKAKGNGSIQLGNGSNSTAKTFQVWSYPLLDGNTGKIPAERLPVKYRFCTESKCGIDKSVIPWLSTNQAFVFTFSFRTPPLKNFANGQAIVITGNTHYDIGFELVMDWEDASETKARIGVGLTTENSSWNLGWTWSDYSLEPLTWYKVRLTYDLSKYTVEYAPENSDNWTTIKEATSSDKLYCNSDISLTQQSRSTTNAIWKYGEVDINSFKATSGNTTYIDGVYSLRNLITLPTNSSQVKEYYEIG